MNFILLLKQQTLLFVCRWACLFKLLHYFQVNVVNQPIALIVSHLSYKLTFGHTLLEHKVSVDIYKY
jgi:hypothetical protein